MDLNGPSAVVVLKGAQPNDISNLSAGRGTRLLCGLSTSSQVRTWSSYDLLQRRSVRSDPQLCSSLSLSVLHIHQHAPHSPDLSAHFTHSRFRLPRSVRRKHQHTTVWGNLSTDGARTAPGDDVTLCTYIDLQHSHFRPASCIQATNIPYSQLISLIKLSTNSHHLDIEHLRHARPRVPRSRRACPWGRAPNALHDELHCTLECPHSFQHPPPVLRPCSELARSGN
jgi:hypothetical protein